MACPRCGEICHCLGDVCAATSTPPRPRFEVDDDNSQPLSAVLIDPEPYDATEEQFSASLENSGSASARFVPDRLAAAIFDDDPALASSRPENQSNARRLLENCGERGPVAASQTQSEVVERERAVVRRQTSTTSYAGQNHRLPSGEPSCSGDPDRADWKEEVAARLSSYRARRTPRPPKYPSLALNFDPPVSQPDAGTCRSDIQSALAIEQRPHPPAEHPSETLRSPQADENARTRALPNARVIEFPRFFAPTEASPDQLAEPVWEHPRILDAPEVELPAPALGGIVLETSAEKEESEARPGFEVPLHSATVGRRVFAAAIDWIFVAAAGVMFAYIFRMLAQTTPPLSHLLASAAMVAITLWAAFQYLLLTYSGATPGIRIARLKLSHFDGSAVPRSTRRWRVLASVLSGVSLGLGFAWCFLDEDALCWHDRITRTHLTPRE
jgi:uncharacterized RDD family membrane protein YckC